MSSPTLEPPVRRAVVCERGTQNLWWVLGHRVERDGRVIVEVCPRGKRRGAVTRRLEDLQAGWCRDMKVCEVPAARSRASLGEGRVVATRRLGGCDQALVMFHERGRCVWIPAGRLREVRPPEAKFALEDPVEGAAECARLGLLARALERWHENTGALGRLEIDPLPHQLHLVHHILRSGNLNWLIADDVGLGKTIEVGMILAALRERRGFERILVVTPAGLTRQWQEELGSKFGMDDFLIYGRDFHVHDPSLWRMYPRVIASIDRLKHDNHLPVIAASGRWDLVVFDEAHRLSRREWGSKIESTQRYRLARQLRAQTDHLMLLTATPHQGRADQFRALLELLRPEWAERFDRLEAQPELLRELVYRNRKADVTNADGEFIFHGQDVHAVPVALDEAERDFDRALQRYFREGYDRAERLGGETGRAIGFVMTTFRKLAASSHAAILRALRKRRDMLLAREDTTSEGHDGEWDARHQGEWEEARAAQPGSSFFEDEIDQLEALIEQASELVDQDSKLVFFLEELLAPMLAEEPARKLLVFTEFRATQDLLAQALVARHGAGCVGLIHGGMSLDEKRATVEGFRDELQFVVSTEAGGEGINLHHRCHTMVNYDLPWNPMRLVQRMGRLYRYGQVERVVVFNLQTPDTLDGHVVGRLHERIGQVVRDMGGLSEEFDEHLYAAILGELSEQLDVEALLAEAARERPERTGERIDEAIERARQAHALERELLEHAHHFDPDELAGQLPLGREHLLAFVEGMLAQLGCRVLERQHGGQVWQVELTDEVRQRLGVRARTLRVTADRELSRFRDVHMLDAADPLLRLLLERARELDGDHAAVALAGGELLVGARLCWQDGAGALAREELVLTRYDRDGHVEANTPALSQWLAHPAQDATGAAPAPARRRELVGRALEDLDARLGAGRNRYLHPMLQQLLTVAWCQES